MTKRLASNRSARWAFMDRFEVPDYDDPLATYLTRWRVIQTPWFGLYVHRYEGPDPRRTLHDHPWSFRSFVLRGGYIERRLRGRWFPPLASMEMSIDEAHIVRRSNRFRRGEFHSIIRLLRVPTWTLLIVGPRHGTWGYLEPGRRLGVDGWRFTEFDAHPHDLKFREALAERTRLRVDDAQSRR